MSHERELRGLSGWTMAFLLMAVDVAGAVGGRAVAHPPAGEHLPDRVAAPAAVSG